MSSRRTTPPRLVRPGDADDLVTELTGGTVGVLEHPGAVAR
ncbi:hypothetical protein ACWCPM_27045 [Streptomyces sp. NPDC002309]